MATAFLPQHTIENTDYAGQAYYGIDIDEPANPRSVRQVRLGPGLQTSGQGVAERLLSTDGLFLRYRGAKLDRPLMAQRPSWRVTK